MGDLESIKIVFCDRNGTLWGIPYEMREGQSPRHLLGIVSVADMLRERTVTPFKYIEHHGYDKREPSALGWLYLGSWVDRPKLALSWWGTMDSDRLAAVRAWMVALSERHGTGFLPGGFPEWVRV